MTQRYDLTQAEAWAQFSGDRNPIHFPSSDPSLPLFAHGMRVLIDLKRAFIHDATQTNDLPIASAQTITLASRFKRPVVYDAPMTIRRTVTKSGARYQLGAEGVTPFEDAMALTVKLSEQASTPDWPTSATSIDTPQLSDAFHSFLGVVDGQTVALAPWLFWDNYLFKRLLMGVGHDPSAGIQEDKGLHLQTLFQTYAVIQTHQTLTMNQAFMHLQPTVEANALQLYKHMEWIQPNTEQGGGVLSANLWLLADQAWLRSEVLLQINARGNT